MESSKLHIAIVSSPGMGHVIPVLVLGNRLATTHDIKVTIIVITTTTSSDKECQFLKTLNLSKFVSIIGLPPVDISAKMSPTAGAVAQLYMSVSEALPYIRSAIASMDHQPDTIIFDLFCTSALPIARELHIPAYLYVSTNAWATAFFIYGSVLDKEVEGQYVDQKEPLKIPGCKSVRPEDVSDPMFNRNDQEYKEYIKIAIEMTKSDGMLINTWEDIEPTSVQALRGNKILSSIVNTPVHPIGPLTRPVETPSLKVEISEWLDSQPVDSVIYVSFGSGGFLSAHQTNELAFGLELSEQRFIWVTRPPTGSEYQDSLDYLPEGFLNRTRKVGFVVPNWAQQVEILNHPAVGGFLSHCGWNSTLESIRAGVPMIAWPLYAEQRQNATMLTEDIGVAVRPEVLPTKKVVGREEIEKMVRKIMQHQQGGELREKMKTVKFSGENALSKGGSSFNSLSKVLGDIRSNMSQ